jgi:integrase
MHALGDEQICNLCAARRAHADLFGHLVHVHSDVIEAGDDACACEGSSFWYIAAMHPRYRALVILAAGTGLRAGELFGLQVGHVDLLRGRVRVEQQLHEIAGRIVVGPPKTSRSHRTVPLSVTVRLAVDDHIRRYPPLGPDSYLFTAPNGGPIRRTNFMRSYWNPAADGWCTGRHSTARTSPLLRVGADRCRALGQGRVGSAGAHQCSTNLEHLCAPVACRRRSRPERSRRRAWRVRDGHGTDRPDRNRMRPPNSGGLMGRGGCWV